jgi:hypothetical protein
MVQLYINRLILNIISITEHSINELVFAIINSDLNKCITKPVWRHPANILPMPTFPPRFHQQLPAPTFKPRLPTFEPKVKWSTW